MKLEPQSPKEWVYFINNLNNDLDKDEIEAWVSKLTLIDYSTNSVVIGGLNHFFCNWIKVHHHNLLRKHLLESFHSLKLKDDFQLIIQTGKDKTQILTSKIKAQNRKFSSSEDGLNPDFCFDSFVNGSNSEIAYAAARAIGDNIANNKYNPLFLCGAVGLGKTHLVQAIGIQAKTVHKNVKVLYANSRDFTNDVINEIRFGKIQNIRNKYRLVDLLIIDDIQFLENKETTQQEFFHIFNELIQNKKQIVLTADRYPMEIKKLEERLVNRFNSGMVARIEPPDFETRVAIIRTKIEQINLPLSDDLINYIAQAVKNNVRDILGILLHLEANWSLLGQDITLELIKRILREFLKLDDNPKTIDNIIKIISSKLDVKLSEIKSDKRDQKISKARQIAMYIAREVTGFSYPIIGKEFGGKNHSSVIQACKNIKQLIVKDPEIKQMINTIIRELKP